MAVQYLTGIISVIYKLDILLSLLLIPVLCTSTYDGEDQDTHYIHGVGADMTSSVKPTKADLDVVSKFLNLVEEYERHKDNCSTGTSYNLGTGVVMQYGVLRFKRQALVAVGRANFYTRLWTGPDPSLWNSQYLFYTSVRNMLESDEDLFAAGSCHDQFQFKNYNMFCPYAYRLPNGRIMVKDLSLAYPYLGNDSEWFHQAKLKASMLSGFNITIGEERMRISETSLGPIRIDRSLTVRYEDGHWSLPYFDCGGGNIWMMTYTVPFFGKDKYGHFHFKGTSGIDIDLQKVDINQCHSPPGSPAMETNVFAGSSKCKEDTTECVPVQGLGFRRGSYKCYCKRGYYFPDPDSGYTYFNGSEIEYEFEKKMKGNEENYYDAYFNCLKCAPGCDECTDSRPCVISLDWVQRSILLGLSCMVMASIAIMMLFVWTYREVKILRAASPVLLNIILLGALLLYSPMIVSYFEATEITCSLRLWLRELGFSISYGALLLKTWRISVVFRVKSAQRVKISDTDLIKRLAIIASIFLAWMAVRTVVGRPQVVQGRHTSGLKAFQCSFDVWDYCAAVGELLLLLWGIRLCIVVRKAPSEFNESRFISWAIYNETLLSLFLNISMLFLQSPSNPDLLYLVLFLHTQLTTTVTLAFLFGSKAYVVIKHRNKEQTQTTVSRGSKYVAAPRGGGGAQTTLLSTVTSGGTMGTMGALGEKNEDSDYSSNVEKDLQEEFKKIYMQLEVLRQKNLKLGSSHLDRKITAMIDASVKQDLVDSTPSSPNVNGKRVVISMNNYTDATSV
ncbi:metabotropic glycine receptor-like [Lineus longissimus]|uniref:metabotropic glycine receptor-like n=1 Tax=Lineus longissimus TaxID=88925 RepID=UPI00315D51BE